MDPPESRIARIGPAARYRVREEGSMGDRDRLYRLTGMVKAAG